MRYEIKQEIYGYQFSFITDDKCFSPKAIDKGTYFMLTRYIPEKGQKVHDLGCGYGVVGIACAKITGEENVFMSDIKHLQLASENAVLNGVPQINIVKSDGYKSFPETNFDTILCNPPYHSDFSVPKHFIEKGFNRLNIGGRMFFVVKRLEWYKRKFISIFGGVKVFREADGYFVLAAEKKMNNYKLK